MAVGFNNFYEGDSSQPPRRTRAQRPRSSYSVQLTFLVFNPSSPFMTIIFQSNTSPMPLTRSNPRCTRPIVYDVVKPYPNYLDPVPRISADDSHVETPEVAQTRWESSLSLRRQWHTKGRACDSLPRLPIPHR